MAATSCNRATTRSTSRCSSRRGWKTSRRRCTTSIPCITSAEMALAPELIDAYENADYVVFTDPELVLRIGEPSPRLDALLEAEGAAAAAYITAANPRGELKTQAENESARAALDEPLASAGDPRHAGQGPEPEDQRAAEPRVLGV